jgi:ParB-like chromosome segregation protein Spo0J
MKISDIKIGERFRKDLGDIQTLANSIKEIGLLQPVVINDGFR